MKQKIYTGDEICFLYEIRVQSINGNKSWNEFDGLEYDEKEAARAVRLLNKVNKGTYKFKKVKTGTCRPVTLFAR